MVCLLHSAVNSVLHDSLKCNSSETYEKEIPTQLPGEAIGLLREGQKLSLIHLCTLGQPAALNFTRK